MPAPEERRYRGVYWHASHGGWVVVAAFKKRPLRSTFFVNQEAAAQWLAKQTGQPKASLKKIPRPIKKIPQHTGIYWHHNGWEVFKNRNKRRRSTVLTPRAVCRIRSSLRGEGSRVEG